MYPAQQQVFPQVQPQVQLFPQEQLLQPQPQPHPLLPQPQPPFPQLPPLPIPFPHPQQQMRTMIRTIHRHPLSLLFHINCSPHI